MATVGELREQWRASREALPDRLLAAINTEPMVRAMHHLARHNGATDDEIDAILRLALMRILVELADYASEVTQLSTDRTSAPELLDLARRIQEGVKL